MEEAQFWMLTKRKHSLTSHLQVSACDNDSWEELAFAEDAAGALGGCIWPPRSYSCSFCRREFRSAQALGGHMNVHRRDRARLKQSPPLPENDQNLRNNILNVSNTSAASEFQYPDSHNQICSSLCSPNPKLDPIICPSSSLSMNFTVKNLFPSFPSPTRKDREVSPRSSPSSYHIGPDRKSEEFKDSENIQSGLGEEEEGILCKRRRISTSIGLPFFVKTNSNDRNLVRSEIFEVGNCSKEELDLELRLGDGPKVK